MMKGITVLFVIRGIFGEKWGGWGLDISSIYSTSSIYTIPSIILQILLPNSVVAARSDAEESDRSR